jgi:uncharacterized protein (DUF885 family)
VKKLLLAVALAAGSGCGFATTGSGGIGAVSCGFGFSKEPPSNGTASAGSDFSALRDRFFLYTLQTNPVISTYLGGEGYSDALKDANGRLRDYSPEALSKEAAEYRKLQDGFRAIDPTTLPAASRVDYELIAAQHAFLIHQNVDRKYFQRAVDTYVMEPFRGLDWQQQGMQDMGGGQLGTEDEWRLVLARLDAVPHYLEVARSNLLDGRQSGNLPDKRVVQRDGIAGAAADADYFRNVLPKNAGAYIGSRSFGARLLPQLKQAGERAASAADAFGAFLKSTYDLDEKLDRYAVGTAEYEWRVHNVFRDRRTAAELYEYGAQQVTQYQSRMEEVARRISDEARLALRFGTDQQATASVRAVMAYLSRDSPANDDELFRWYREAAARAVAYGREQGLFGIPRTYRLDIVPTPQVLLSSIDAAYYPAPPFKKTGVGRFYLSPTGNDPGALKVNNRSSIADTAVHEGFPGHDWHFKFMTQHASEISNVRWLTPGAVEDSSSMWSDSMATEGWGLYAEELMAEPNANHPYGFYTPGEYFYELQGQMMRAVRVRVDVGIHTGRMSFEEARDYFTAHVDFLPSACRQGDAVAKATCDAADRAIYRYSKWPTQAISYNLGKNAIIQLREAYKRQMGQAYSAVRFHEELMRTGQVPAGFLADTFGR